MNNGKICVSVCADNADVFMDKINRAAKIADVIELRFDCLGEKINQELLARIQQALEVFDGIVIGTLRPRREGGKRDISFEQRREFWINPKVLEIVDWIDLEEDIHQTVSKATSEPFIDRIFVSNHNLVETPENLNDIFKRISAYSETSKIAVQISGASDACRVWHLLHEAKQTGRKAIPIAMGETGKWTRILGLAHGAPLTYASLEEGDETASGQISARDLIDIYRVKKLDLGTEVYGVIGNPVSHSLSPYIHNEAFAASNTNAVYIPFHVNILEEFLNVMVKAKTREVELNFKGFSVTIPYKEAILEFLDVVDRSAKAIGAVNTVKIRDEKLYGYNTDAAGFIQPLRRVWEDLTRARIAIIGAGGAARAAIYGLKKESAEITVYVRDIQKYQTLGQEFDVTVADINEFAVGAYDIVVNCTPLGMRGGLENKTPLFAKQLKNVQLAYDLVYNPISTRFLREAESAGAKTLGGLDMFLSQAVEQQKIWTGQLFEPSDFRSLITSRLDS